MKISAVPRGTQPSSTPNIGTSASPDKIARAKAIMTGEPAPAPAAEPAVETTAEKLRKIRMKTNATPAPREFPPQAEAIAEPAPAAELASPNISAEGEPATAASEDSKPLSPQFAALAKHRRALELREKAVAAREEAFKQTSQSTTDAKELVERMKADPLGLLLENGVTYDQLTQAVLRDMEGGGPALTKVEQELRKELKTLQDKFDAQAKAQDDKWTQAHEDALTEMQAQADQIIASDDAYQTIRDAKANEDVKKLIKTVWNEEKKTLSVKEALDLIENDLVEEGLRYAKFKKVQERANPAPAPQQIQSVEPQDGVRRQTMRTLSNRDAAPSVQSRKDRAIAAFYGRKPV